MGTINFEMLNKMDVYSSISQNEQLEIETDENQMDNVLNPDFLILSLLLIFVLMLIYSIICVLHY